MCMRLTQNVAVTVRARGNVIMMSAKATIISRDTRYY